VIPIAAITSEFTAVTDIPFVLDITADVCPLTFVKTKLLLEKMPVGALARVRLKGAEPLDNVPRSVRAHGHEVVSLTPETAGASQPGAPHILIIRRR
jgi:TusA-related sulfurtransferase